MCVKSALGIALLVLAAGAASSCSDPGDSVPTAVRGADRPRFERAARLLATARGHGIRCDREAAFNPVQNVAPDSIGYAIPDGRMCYLASGATLYVVVYDTLPHRVEAADHGEAQVNLCARTSQARRALVSLNGLVAGNWRVATPGSSEELAGLRAALGGTAQAETLSCQFRA